MPQLLWLFSTAYRDVVANCADGADGADGRGSVLDAGAYLDRPCSSSSLPTKSYFNAQHTKERLCATQPASEGGGIFRPVRASFRDIVIGNIGRGTQKFGSGARPTAAIRHEFADANSHRVHLDNAFDCGFVVRIIGARKGARRPQRCFASRGPQGEVCHPRQAGETNSRQCLQATYCSIKQGAQDARARNVELAPKLAFGAPLLLTNWC